MTAPIVFLDTETTGLSLADDIWEFAGIRREGDGSPDVPLHLFVEHDEDKVDALPEKFRADYEARFEPEHAISRRDAARLIHRHLRPGADGTRAHVVGAVPNFDTERISFLLAEHGLDDPWHHHLTCVESLMVGYLHGRAVGLARPGMTIYRPDIPLPWSSDDLSRDIGVTAPTDARHTAMGDAEWARAIYDRITGGASWLSSSGQSTACKHVQAGEVGHVTEIAPDGDCLVRVGEGDRWDYVTPTCLTRLTAGVLVTWPDGARTVYPDADGIVEGVDGAWVRRGDVFIALVCGVRSIEFISPTGGAA